MPGCNAAFGISHNSLRPIANCSGLRPSPSCRRRSNSLVRLPRTPSQKIVTFARMSTPGSKVAFCSPSLPMPRSPVRTPMTRVAVR